MATLDELKIAALNMLKVNLDLQDGEKAVFVTDIAIPADWDRYDADALEDICQRALMTRRMYEQVKQELKNNQVDFFAYPITPQSGSEPPADVAARFKLYDVVVLMTTNSLTHTHAREEACLAGAKVASMPGIEAGMFAANGPMTADYQKIALETEKWADVITKGRQVRVTTPAGTDLRFSIEGRPGGIDSGLIKKGQFGNLPAGEAYTAPVEGTAEGVLVAQVGWFPGLKEDMKLTFEAGYVSKVEGGCEVGDQFRALFAFGDESKKHRRNCAELGIGTNPNAKKADNVLEAEKIYGTVHIAVGDSSHLGGVTESDLHEDFVQPQVSLYIDNQKVMG